MTGGAVVDAPVGPPVVELSGISKAFGPVLAVNDVSLDLRAGEVHCLAGENGAGKSTLIKILTGALRRDAGTYRIAGETMPRGWNPTAAAARGIGVVYQELSLLPDLSVAENLFMGRLPAAAGVVRQRVLRRRATEWLAKVGLENLDPGRIVSELRPATRQLVEIAKVLGRTRARSFSTNRRRRCPARRPRPC